MLLTHVRRLDKDGVSCDPVPERPLKWADVEADRIVIQPRRHRLVDIAAVDRGVNTMLIAIKNRDPSGRDKVPPGIYELFLQVSARGAKPHDYRATMQFVADWATIPSLSDHLKIIEVQPGNGGNRHASAEASR